MFRLNCINFHPTILNYAARRLDFNRQIWQRSHVIENCVQCQSPSCLTCDLWVEKIRIRLPQVVEKLRRQSDVVVAIFEQIVGQSEPRLKPLLVDEHVNTKVHVLDVNGIYVDDEHAELDHHGIPLRRRRAHFLQICFGQNDPPYRRVLKSKHQICELTAKKEKKIMWQRQGREGERKSMCFMYHRHLSEWAM